MSNKVISKYFSTKTGMDDSLSDFQEKKKYNTGPKNVKKPRNIKKPKRTRGQKDIRALIKNQENDVLSYSKDFNKICKQAGVDVDAEELQLAIALSKSHHDVKKENSSDIETNSTEHMTSQQRILKIKTSLQEYGFRVPKTKITETNKRKRFKKQYKLLLTSKTERQQIIFDKYSEVLAGNIFKSPTKVFECDYSDKELYYKATNIAYEHIKNDNLYYVTDLFHKSCHKNCLLRNWSEIPGRPLSPTVEVININFDDIICNQHELDCILSGTIFAAQQIVTNKNRDIIHNNTTTIDKTVQLGCQKSKPLKNEVGHVDNVSGLKLSTENFTLTETNCYTNSNTMSNSQLRSVSPDLFDDEVSAEMEFPDNDVQLSGQTLSKNDNIHTYCMDLTECVNIDLSDLHAKTKTNTNGINITNRKSNDLMEKTECVSSTSSKQINVENVNLTQSSNESNKQNDNILYQNENIEIMDLTQVKDYDPMPEKINDTEKDYSLDKTVILVDDDTTVLVYDSLKMQPQKQNLSIIDLPESICIDDINNGEDDSSIKNGKDQSSGNGFKDHFYNKSYESNCGYKSKLQNIGEVSEYVNELVEYQPGELDLTQSSNSSLGEMLTNQPISNYSTSLGKRDNVSIDYDEINNICSESINSLKSDDCRYESYSLKKEANKSNKDIASNPNKTSKAFECLENESNYSIHQSKHYMNIDFRCTTFMNHEYSSPEKDACNANHDSASNPSKNSEVFEISDKEFNYSLHHSKQDNFDFRDVSVMNDFSHYKNHSVGESSHYSTTRTRSFSESNLQKENIISPVKEQSQSQKLNFNSEIFNVVTVPKQNTKNVLNTPKNGEFTIKTNEVTPMLDYASMSTPERHKELEKYGLKPFKRKRAIQLLTYVYNQTHPVVESHDDCPSPSKRKKKDEQDKKCSSPQKSSNSVPLDSINKISKASVEPIESIPKVNDLYAITTEQPDIRNIECDTEDWFFQKREKAKLYSCRVPLHVAFHNYVSCRRRLREAILRYEPVNIDVIHKDLVATGYRYNPKDLLKFMDRKCITVKTADNSRNRKL